MESCLNMIGGQLSLFVIVEKKQINKYNQKTGRLSK